MKLALDDFTLLVNYKLLYKNLQECGFFWPKPFVQRSHLRHEHQRSIQLIDTNRCFMCLWQNCFSLRQAARSYKS
jgi:hypothetical protein